MPEVNLKNGIAIELQNISKSYGNRKVLDNITLNIRQGEFLAIVGHSGCGKSTLLRLLSELETPTEGALYFDQKNSLKDDQNARRFMFQDARLLPWKNVFDNVMIGLPHERKENADRLLFQVGLSDRHHEWPARLSGGQKQRISLARALASEPKLLLLDEPLGALDALTRLDMQALIEKLWQTQGCTAILVTHDVSEAVALADRVLFMSEGKIAQETEIRLARPRQKNNDTTWFEQQILNRILGKERQGTPDFVQI